MHDDTDHIDVETLSAFADAELEDAITARIQRHLAQCDVCRRRLEAIRAMVASVAKLPRSVEPPAQLWNDVRVGIRADARRRRGAWVWSVAGLAAAAAIAFVVMRPLEKTAAPRAVATTVVDRNYAGAVAMLRGTMEAQRSSFPPGAARSVDRSLAVIDTAIGEVRQELARDPANRQLLDILSANYERKLELMQRAAELSSD